MLGNKTYYSYHFLSTFLFILLLGNIKAYAHVIENPVFDRKDVEEFRVDKVEITQDTTFLYCSYYAVAGSWANMSKDAYLLDVNSKHKYTLLKCDGLPYSPNKKEFIYDERCKIILCFNNIRKTTKFDLIEIPSERAFNVYGIDISSNFEKTYKDTDPNRLFTMSSFYDSSGDTLKAIQYKKEEINAVRYNYGIESKEYYESQLMLCILFDKYDLQKEKLELTKKLETYFEHSWSKKDWNYAINMRTVAGFYSDSGMYEKSIDKYKESIKTFETLNIIDKEYALALGFLSGDYFKVGDYFNSLKYQKQCLDVRRKLEDADNYTNELINTLLPANKNNKDIIKDRINVVSNELNNLPSFVDPKSYGIAEVHKYIARSFNLLDKYNDAVKHCDLALEILYGNGQGYINECNEILSLKCTYLIYAGHKKDALKVGLDVKKQMDSLQVSSVKYAKILHNLSDLFAYDFDYENAIELEKAACDIYEAESDWMECTNSLQQIAKYYKYTLDYDNAEVNLKKAIESLNKYDDVNHYYSSEVSRLGNSYISFDAVKEYYYSVKVLVFSELASIHAAKGDFLDAITAEEVSFNNAKEQSTEDSYAVSLSNLSLYKGAIGKIEEAINYAKQSIAISEKLGNGFAHVAKLNLSLLYMKRGEIENALKYANELLNYIEIDGDNRKKTAVYGIIASCYARIENVSKADSCFTNMLDDLKKNIVDDISGMNILQKQRMWDKYKLFFLQYRKFVCENYKSNEQISKLFNYVLFSKSLMLDSDNTDKEKAISRYNITWKDIQKKLKDNEIAIEFIATRGDSIYNNYYALVIDNTCMYPDLITLYSESDYEKIRQKSSMSIINIVGNLIWSPILNKYKHVRNIYFSPDGVTHILAIENCILDSIGEIKSLYNLYRLSSTKELTSQKLNANKRKAILYGGLDYNSFLEYDNNKTEGNGIIRSINARGGFEPLYYAYEEVNEISKILNNRAVSTKIYVGNDGTEESFKNISGIDVDIIHLSTHGMYVEPMMVSEKKKENNFGFLENISNDDDPVKEQIVMTHSFLVMSGGNKYINHYFIEPGEDDGILTALEISNMQLRNVDLVVLSACESGFGDLDIDGIFGLQRGFKKAGVNTILMSLDKVDDEATKILMVEFYRNLMNGKSKHQSLKDAQKYLRQVDNGKYDKPEYWASFVMLDGLS